MYSPDLFISAAPQFYRFLLSFLWQSSLFLGSVYLITRFFKDGNPQVHNRIWLLSLILLPTLPLFGTFIPHLLNINALFQSPVTLDTNNLTWMSLEYINSGLATIEVVGDSKPSLVSILLANNMLFIPFIYVIVLSILAIQILMGYLKVSSWKRSNTLISDPEILKLFNDASYSLGMRKKITLFQNQRITIPLTFGFFSPVVVIPASILEDSNFEEIKGIAIHELTHVKRLDTLSFSYASIIKTLFFFQPLVWVAVHKMIHTAEEVCDGEAIRKSQTPLAYAKLLSRIAEQLPKRSFNMNTSPSFMSGKKTFVNRIKSILSFNEIGKKPVSRKSEFFVIGLTLLFFSAAMSMPLQFSEPEVYFSPTEEISEVNETGSKIDVSNLIEDIHPIHFPIGDVSDVGISNRFGDSKDPYSGKEVFHKGIDFTAKKGASVFATADGTVKGAALVGDHGNRIVIEHADGFQTRYSHLDKIVVKAGDPVKAGQKIGLVGSTGRSTGPHLHYEIRYNGGPIDPLKIIQKGDFRKKLQLMDEFKKYGDRNEYDSLPEIVGGQEELYKYIHSKELYPEKARQEGITGFVDIQFMVNVDGKASDFIVLEENPKGYGFSKVAMEAVKNLEFAPAKKNGKPIPATSNVRLKFKLD